MNFQTVGSRKDAELQRKRKKNRKNREQNSRFQSCKGLTGFKKFYFSHRIERPQKKKPISGVRESGGFTGYKNLDYRPNCE